MEVSALKFSGGTGLHGRSPLLRLQSDERLVVLVRRGSTPAFEVLVARYEQRLLAFCRHLLRSREDAEDVLQEVMAAAYNALMADERPVNVRPWLYRIARNRSLNHLRRTQAIGVDTMDIHFSDYGASTADKAHDREEFRLLIGDIHELAETQRTALVLREMDALSYEQIAEAMETTVSSVKSLLVRARVSLAEASEGRLITCDEVRDELGEIAEGLTRKQSAAVRRHLRTCRRCDAFRVQLKETNKALAALLPFGPLVVFKKFVLAQLGHHAGSGATAAGAGSTAAGGTIAAGTSAGSLISAGVGAVATKAAAGLAAAALVTAGAVEVDHSGSGHARRAEHPATASALAAVSHGSASIHPTTPAHSSTGVPAGVKPRRVKIHRGAKQREGLRTRTRSSQPMTGPRLAGRPTRTPATKTATIPVRTTPAPPGRTLTQTSPTVLPPAPVTSTTTTPTTTPATTPTTTTPPATTPTPTTTPSSTPSTTPTSPPTTTSPAAP